MGYKGIKMSFVGYFYCAEIEAKRALYDFSIRSYS